MTLTRRARAATLALVGSPDGVRAVSTLVSACLLGFACRHDGRDKRDPRLLAALSDEEVVPVCPEIAGGLGVPREPAFLDGARVVDARGREVTDRFAAGAAAAVLAARAHGCSRAILKIFPAPVRVGGELCTCSQASSVALRSCLADSAAR